MRTALYLAVVHVGAGARHHRVGFVILVLIVLAAVAFLIVRLSSRKHASNPSEDHWPPPVVNPTSAAGERDTASRIDVGEAVVPSQPEAPDSNSPRQRPTSAKMQNAVGPFAVEVHGLTKRFGANIAVDDVDLVVPKGSAFGYLGPNGAGKTTLMRTLLGLTRADSGTISLLGIPVPQQRQVALARVGAIVDEPRFFEHLTGRQNLAILAATRGGDADKRIAPSLERVGLSERADHKVSSYSMGMRQRLGVASCLLGDPELLILDEPMNGLDPAGMHEMRSMIASLVEEGRTVMLSSHLLDEVERTCDAVAIVDRGRVIRQGPIDELVRSAGSGAVEIECADVHAAAELLRQAGFEHVATDSRLRVTLSADATRQTVAEINRRLVEGGIEVYRLEEVRTSLEDWFLSVTSRFGAKP